MHDSKPALGYQLSVIAVSHASTTMSAAPAHLAMRQLALVRAQRSRAAGKMMSALVLRRSTRSAICWRGRAATALHGISLRCRPVKFDKLLQCRAVLEAELASRNAEFMVEANASRQARFNHKRRSDQRCWVKRASSRVSPSSAGWCVSSGVASCG
jgi:hypothetical protein